MQLRPYQSEAVDAVWTHLRTKRTHPVVVVPTAGGKTPIMATLCRDVSQKWNRRVLVLAAVKELLEQTHATLKRCAPDLLVGIYSAGLKQRDLDCPVTVAGIQSIWRRACEFDPPPDLVLIDEAHQIPQSGEGRYQSFLKELQICNPRVRLAGLTATPYRTGFGPIVGDDCLFDEVCYEVGVRPLVEAGWLSKLVSRNALDIDTSRLHVRSGEFVAEEAEEMMLRLVESACRELVALSVGRKSILVFCQSVAHAEAVRERIESLTGESAGLVTGTSLDFERATAVERFKAGTLRWLVNINVFTTGFDAPNVDCVALLRPTMSPGLYYQMCLSEDTEILAADGWKRRGEIAVGDLVWGVDASNGLQARLVAASSVTNRPIHPAESFIALNTRNGSLMVTDNHDLLVAGRRVRRWHKETAKKTSARKDSWRMPVAAVAQFPGVPLSDAELSLLGWYLTDGNINTRTNALTIVQSVKSPYLREIERVLNNCGLKWRTYRVPASTSQFTGASDRIHYRVSKGKPRSSGKHLRGWGHLEPYMGKDISDLLMQCTREQFVVLLQAAFHGDGIKRKSVYWTPRTKEICSGRKRFVDRLQAMAVLRGFRCSVFMHHYNKNPIFMLNIKDTTVRHVPGANQEGRIGLKTIAQNGNERVWCISNELGTIITRHNGHVSIVGNCGRGFRLFPGKTDCLVLDFGNNIRRHGPVDRIEAGHRPKPNEGQAKTKACPSCQSEIPVAATECPDCGHEFPPPERPLATHDASAAGDSILSDGKPEEHDVVDVSYHVHMKRGAPPDAPCTMRVEYHVDLATTFREWVCVEHDGFAGGKARAWWMARSNDPFPESALHAVQIACAGGVAAAKRIRVLKKGGDSLPQIVVVDMEPKPEETGIPAGRMPGDEDDWEECVPSGATNDDDIPF